MASENVYGYLTRRPTFTLSEPLVYLTISSVFSEALVVRYGIDIKFFYLVVLIGSAAVATGWNFRLNLYHVLSVVYLWITGLWAVFAGTSTVLLFLEQALGITVCSTYFYLFLRNQRRSLKEIFELYARFAYYVCWIGLLVLPITSILASQYRPVQGILTEPEHFATVVLPAAFFYLSNAVHRRRNRKEAVVTLLAILLSGSATAFAGVVIAITLLLKSRYTTLAVGLLLASLFCYAMYTLDPHTQVRVDDSLSTVKTMDVTGANMSVYATVSNLYVTSRVLEEHPWFGVGIGGHRLAHEEFIGALPGSTSFDDYMDANSQDAASLLLRVVSELGFVGLGLVLLFLWHFYLRGNSDLATLSNAVLVYFALKLLREGHWFSPEMYFFVWVYVFAWMERRNQQSDSGAPLVLSAPRS